MILKRAVRIDSQHSRRAVDETDSIPTNDDHTLRS
ncbi:hypothetical protein T12_4328 [Trichinella patagoniensis]|uniref:Uncharacterized protein n=1 Tax=Trichinella patagoniensis TaxID=990121 RepID=A0A0V0XLB0_9BILA|nr:hypothetical protein T12_4328 [Trichinella patagoniensis]